MNLLKPKHLWSNWQRALTSSIKRVRKLKPNRTNTAHTWIHDKEDPLFSHVIFKRKSTVTNMYGCISLVEAPHFLFTLNAFSILSPKQAFHSHRNLLCGGQADQSRLFINNAFYTNANKSTNLSICSIYEILLRDHYYFAERIGIAILDMFHWGSKKAKIDSCCVLTNVDAQFSPVQPGRNFCHDIQLLSIWTEDFICTVV